MTWLDIVLGVYAIFTMFAGTYGYLKSGSAVSMIAGLVAGLVVIAGIFIARSKPTIGYGMAALITILMIGRFLPTFLKEPDPYKALWPALAMVVTSAIALLCLALAHLLQRR
jgi:uncharacterized membrane protein (UPF0136 family)